MAQALRRVPNLVWFNYRRIPAVVFAKRLIDEGRIGQTYHYRATYLNQSGNDPSKAKPGATSDPRPGWERPEICSRTRSIPRFTSTDRLRN